MNVKWLILPAATLSSGGSGGFHIKNTASLDKKPTSSLTERNTDMYILEH